MKNAFAIVTLSALLSACAVAPQKPADAPPAVAPADSAEPAEAGAPAAEAPAPEPLPGVELTSDLLYKLTKAELEFKRGQWQGPYITLMALAQQTSDPRLARRAAEMALAAKQGGEALAAIRLWRQLAPESEEAVQYFLGFAVLGDDLGEAEQIFSQRLQTSPPAARGLAMFQMQQFLLRAKDKGAAFALLDRVLQPYGALMESHLVLAQSAFSIGDAARARLEAAEALRLKPESELAVLTVAQVSPDIGSASKILTGFLERHPQAREVRAAYARILVDDKQYLPARKEFLFLLKDQPDSLATLYALGVTSMQSNDIAAAEDYFKRFIGVLGDRPGDERDPSKVLLILSQIAEERGDFDAATGWLDKIDGGDARLYLTAHLKRAQLTARKGDIDDARKQLAELNTADPAEQAQIVQADAQILREAGDTRTAFVVLENALKRFPGNADLLYDHALAAEKLGRLEVMEASLRQVIAAAPDNHHAYNALGYSLAERNVRLDEAYALIDKALQMAPTDPFIMDSMGWVQFRLGHLDLAEELLRRAYGLRNDPEIAVHLGEVLWNKGDKSGARKLWQEAQSKDPKNDALKSTLARLNYSL
ncbi:tetratricopeptide repeat protein [Rugamonas sp. CCM 8940]|uniref:tetratricopeptide repeat protein n=1 Tax=Rugamonas sp. CCM 8940 TaxID=2765359 RepID=UPI0018F3158B|nr:tetratricopeptide repeat protein [Rugamonas sp. CCM 8940]MBJ7310292.1 tetratricopeptide repeat protein [Rugamonas sp. CCM 8940]